MKKLLCLLLAVLLLLSAPAMAEITSGNDAVIAHCSEYVTLRQSPSKDAAASIRIPLGERVEILGFTQNGFVQVQYFDRTGYVLEDYLEPYEENTAYVPQTQTVSGYSIFCGNYGTAKHIEGRTVVVSIFANDATTSWNFNENADMKLRLRTRFNLSVAVTWLTEQTRRYRSNPGGFVWDWREHGDLYYETSFAEDVVHGVGDSGTVQAAINSYIHENIPTKQLLEKYRADNIIYNVYLNAPNSTDYRSWSTGVLYSEVDAARYAPEICVFVPYGHGRENTPAVFAHEMLHCFGAYDLYETWSGSPITQAYVDHLNSHNPNDLMNHCYFSAGDIITTEFSEVDAYYVGLIDSCADVRNWNLGPSIFERFAPN